MLMPTGIINPFFCNFFITSFMPGFLNPLFTLAIWIWEAFQEAVFGLPE